jgi:4-hydroxybenzoate polyprenyltransferase
MNQMIRFNLFQQLRIKGWIAITIYALIGLLLNGLKGIDLTYCLLICSMFVLNGFWYIYNDYIDAPYDRLDPMKQRRNVFCEGEREKILLGKIIIFATPILSVLLALFAPFKCSIWVFILLVLGYLYSAPSFRAKERPFWDWLRHILWVALNFVPGYLYFFKADLLFYALFFLASLNSLIAQINNEFNDFTVDTLSKHRTTAIIIGKRNTFYLRLALEFLFVFLLGWMAVHYHYYGTLFCLIATFLIFLWYERITVLDKIDLLKDFIKFRYGHIMTIWVAIWLIELGLKKLG